MDGNSEIDQVLDELYGRRPAAGQHFSRTFSLCSGFQRFRMILNLNETKVVFIIYYAFSLF